MTLSATSTQFVKASPAQVYLAFTRALFLHEWLCDYATVAPRPGGRMYLWWHGDFYSAGEYISLEQDKSVVFRWFARFEPGPSEVSVTLTPQDGGTQVSLTHTVSDPDEWQERLLGFKREWDSSLPNLASVLETGLDRRTYDRPMLGINISDFNPEMAKKMGVPVSEGMRLDNLPEKMGAYKAGLRKDDVMVSLAGKPLTGDYGTLVAALQGKKGGDKVEVVFYRGPEKHTVPMTLSKRPVPKVPWEAAELAKKTRKAYNKGLSALRKAFKGVTAEEANFHPAPGEWSANEVLAHILTNERHWLENLDDLIGGYDRYSDDWGGNVNPHMQAVVSAYKNSRGLLAELKRLSDEVVAYAAALPPEFIAHKSSYLAAANMMLNGLLPHTLSHIEQIQSAVLASRAGRK